MHKGIEYLQDARVVIAYELPLNEIVLDFYDRLKSVSRGYASFDYDFLDYRESPLVKLDILVNGEPVDALSFIIHKEYAQARGRVLAERMRTLIPRQLFEVVIQAAIGSKVIARERIAPAAQGRDGQVLRRRHHPQAKAPGEAGRRQAADEAGRPRGDPPGSLHGAPDGRGEEMTNGTG